MNEIKELTFTLDYSYGRLNKKYKPNYYEEKDQEYSVQDILDECDNLYGEYRDLENERDNLQEQLDEANKKIEELENKNE